MLTRAGVTVPEPTNGVTMRAILTALVLAAPVSAQDVQITAPIPGRPDAKMCGGGVVVASRPGGSLIVTVNHAFAVQPAPATPFPTANYPIPCEVTHGGKKYTGTAVAGRGGDSDVALVVVAAELPAAELADTPPAAWSRVRHNGKTSGPAVGVVLDGGDFESTLPAVSGDSGSAVYDDAGRVVSVVKSWLPGRGVMRGSPLAAIRELVAASDFPTNHGPNEATPQQGGVQQQQPKTVRVEQVIADGQGGTYTRIVEMPAGYVVPAHLAPPVRYAVPMRSFAIPVQFGGCANGRCFR